MTDDAELLHAWRAGDAKAGKQLVDRHYEIVIRFFANKVTLVQDRDDLVQETFKACVLGRDRIQAPSRFRAYLLRIAHNVLQRQLRRKYRASEQELASSSMHDLDPGPSTMLREHDEQRRLLVALRELPIDVQTALELKYWEELSSAEIAVVLATPASTVRSLLRRGRMRLAKQLDGLTLPKDDEPNEA